MPIKTFVAAFAAALTSIVALTACSPSAISAQAAKPVSMAVCNGIHQSRPGLMQVICASDAITARSLKWARWGAPVTTATGAAVVNWCAFEGCAIGQYDTYHVVMIASNIKQCPKGRQEYKRLQFVFVGDENPFASLPKNVGTNGLFFGTHQPAPPRKTTLNLPC
jgi:hypothetical protein